MTATANGSANGHAAPLSFATRAIHDGSAADTHTGAVIAPLSLSTTFVQDGVGNLRNGSYEYSRSANPNRRNLEEALASLEGGAEAFAFASGSAATATAVQALASADPTKVRKHVLAVNDVYGGTFRYLARVATEVQSLETTFLDLEASTEQEIYDAIREDTGLIWIETPTNPTLRVIDVAAIVSIAQSHPAKPLVLVDNTFLSPFWSNPIAQGADLVLHSISKYINGHSDVIMGALIVRPGLPALADRVRFLQNAGGAIPSPFDCYLAHRGLKTLPLRGLAHGLSALKLARALEANPLVESVVYPGLKSAGKAQATAKKAISSQAWKALGRLGWKQDEVTETEKEAGGVPFSGMVSFRIKGGAEEADAFLRASHLFALAESLGGVESLAEVPALMTHAGIPEAERAALGITSNLIRLSVGIEDVDDLVADVEQALRVAVHKN